MYISSYFNKLKYYPSNNYCSIVIFSPGYGLDMDKVHIVLLT